MTPTMLEPLLRHEGKVPREQSACGLRRFLGFLLLTPCLAALSGVSASQDQPQKSLKAIVGDYYFGDGLGFNCSLAVKPGGRFTFLWRGCLGVYGRNEGGARIVNDHLILTPEQPNESRGFGSTPTDFIPVHWGERLYLVPKEAGKDFCNEVNQGREPRDNPHGFIYLRRGDWGKKVTGLPNVPNEWKSFLQKKPTEHEK